MSFRAQDLTARLRRVLPADTVTCGPDCARFTVSGMTPLVAAEPHDVQGVRAVLAVATEVGAAVVPWGSGTRQALGYPPRRYDLALCLSRLDAVLNLDPSDLTVTIQAGITHATLARQLAPNGQMLPLDVARPRLATLGGTLACDTPGLRVSAYGRVGDHVLGLRVLGAAGDEVEATGTGQVQVGALGTLGVIVEARLKLVPLPERETTLLGIFGDATGAIDVAPALAALAPCPSALAIVRASGLSPLAHLAPAHGGRALLAARISGAAGAVARAAQQGRAALRRAGARTILSIEPELQDAFWGPTYDFTQTVARRPDEALLRVEAPPSETAEVMRRAAVIAAAHGLRAAELADALGGRVWLRLRPLPLSREDYQDTLPSVTSELPAVCALLRERWPATIILDAPPALKQEVALGSASPPPATLGALRAARQRLDPAGLLNPGRYPAVSAHPN